MQQNILRIKILERKKITQQLTKGPYHDKIEVKYFSSHMAQVQLMIALHSLWCLVLHA